MTWGRYKATTATCPRSHSGAAKALSDERVQGLTALDTHDRVQEGIKKNASGSNHMRKLIG